MVGYLYIKEKLVWLCMRINGLLDGRILFPFRVDAFRPRRQNALMNPWHGYFDATILSQHPPQPKRLYVSRHYRDHTQTQQQTLDTTLHDL